MPTIAGLGFYKVVESYQRLFVEDKRNENKREKKNKSSERPDGWSWKSDACIATTIWIRLERERENKKGTKKKRKKRTWKIN